MVCSTVQLSCLVQRKSYDGVDNHDCASRDCSTSSTWLMAVTSMRLKSKGKHISDAQPNDPLNLKENNIVAIAIQAT